MTDAVVIGAGVVGAATAFALAERGARVEVLEAGDVAGGVSGATFAVDVTRVKTPRHLYDLAVEGGREHEALAEAWGGAPWRHRIDTLEWADAADDERALRERVARLREWGHPAEWISRDEAQELEPALALSPGAPEEIVLFPDGAWYEPGLLAHALLERARSRGALLHLRDPVTALETAGGPVAAVRTRSGRRIGADVVVDCAGPDAGRVAALAGATLPLRRVPGLVAATAPTPTRLRTVVHAGDLNLRPERDGGVLLQSWIHDAELGAEDDPGDPLRPARRMLERARALVPALAGVALAGARVGIRPVPPDGLPLVGFTREVENLYVVVSHSGVHLAPILGRLAARDLMLGRADRLEPFRPTRLPTGGAEPLDESARTMLARRLGAGPGGPPGRR